MFLVFILVSLTVDSFVSASSFASPSPLTLKSQSFEPAGDMPAEFTCDGKDRSPALGWERGPQGTLSYALIMEDPDAPNGNWIHWVLYNLPPPVTNIPSGIPGLSNLANGENQGQNDFGKTGYGGPCPPRGSGAHRYFFRIYALDTVLHLKPGPTAGMVREAMEGHILAEGEWMGTYARTEKTS